MGLVSELPTIQELVGFGQHTALRTLIPKRKAHIHICGTRVSAVYGDVPAQRKADFDGCNGAEH